MTIRKHVFSKKTRKKWKNGKSKTGFQTTPKNTQKKVHEKNEFIPSHLIKNRKEGGGII